MNQNIGPLAVNIPLIVTQIIGFLGLIWFLNRFVFKPIFAILDQRQKEIQDVYDGLDRDRAAMEDTRRQYEQRLAGIEAEARDKINAAVQEAQELRAGLIADAQKQADSIVERGRTESERERQKAFLEMRQQVVSLAVAAAGKVVGESLNDARHTRLVDDFIASVNTAPAANGARPLSGSNGVTAA